MVWFIRTIKFPTKIVDHFEKFKIVFFSISLCIFVYLTVLSVNFDTYLMILLSSRTSPLLTVINYIKPLRIYYQNLITIENI